jgi:hypothetical protein
MWVRNCGAAVPSVASAATVTICRVRASSFGRFPVDRLDHIGCEVGSYVAQRSIGLLRGLPENFTEFLCAASAAFRV